MRAVRSAIFFVALTACSSDAKPAGSDAPGSQVGADASTTTDGSAPSDVDGSAPDIQRSTRSSLQWKRYATFENDLAQALELSPDALCREFGEVPCVRGVHLAPLGGHDPIATGLLESPSEPLVTTPTVVERVVLSACLARLERERSGEARVFAGLDLGGEAPAPDSEQVKALVTSLVRRFHARDPSDDELRLLGALSRDEQGTPVSAHTFASTVCLSVGSSTEFLFF